MKRFAAAVATLCATFAAVIVAASPAAAAYQPCINYGVARASGGGGYVVYVNRAGSNNCELKPSNVNPQVGVLQGVLNHCYGPGSGANGGVPLFSPALVVDNSYGPLTTGAVVKVQQHLGLQDDGWAGPNTRSRMLNLEEGGDHRCLYPIRPVVITNWW